MDVSFTASVGGADGYVAFRRTGASPTFVPVDGTTYTVGNTYGDSTCQHFGAGITFSESGLSALTTYYYDVFAWNGSTGTYVYLTTSPLEGSQITAFAFGNAVHLDGANDDIRTTITNPLSGLAQTSILFWAKADAAVTTNQTIFSTINNAVTQGIFCRFVNPNTIVIFLSNGSISSATYAVGAGITNWNFYEIYFDGSQSSNSTRLVLKVNGNAVTLSFSGTIPATIGTPATAKPIIIGSLKVDAGTYQQWFDGWIDEFAIYNTANTANGTAMYNSGNGGSPPTSGLIRYYPMNEVNTATVVPDSQGNDNGTLTNSNFDATSGWGAH